MKLTCDFEGQYLSSKNNTFQHEMALNIAKNFVMLLNPNGFYAIRGNFRDNIRSLHFGLLCILWFHQNSGPQAIDTDRISK